MKSRIETKALIKMCNILLLIFMTGLFVSGCASLEGTSWTLLDLNGSPMESDKNITVNFENSRIFGSDGCNRYSAIVALRRGEIRIMGEMSTTMIACPESVMEKAEIFTSTLKRTAIYSINDGKLTLLDSGGHHLATFVRKNNELFELSWAAAGYNDGNQAVVSLTHDSNITAVFGADGRLSGFAGCNTYIATYEVSGKTIRIGPASTTRISCAKPTGLMEQEKLYLRALETARTYYIDEDQLELRTGDGEVAVKFNLNLVKLNHMPANPGQGEE